MAARVEARFEVIRMTLEAQAAMATAEALMGAAVDGVEGQRRRENEDAEEKVARIQARLESDLAEVRGALQTIREANLPRVLDGKNEAELKRIALRSYRDAAGEPSPWLNEKELQFLSIARGSLDPDERRQIEAHVVHSYDFLREIPWTEDLGRIAEIVRGHHEKLDGSGYPDGVGADRLSIETRIMTVCDIFDALTASDRPYREAMPVQRALDVLWAEAEAGALDRDVVELFVGEKVYERVLDEARPTPPFQRPVTP